MEPVENRQRLPKDQRRELILRTAMTIFIAKGYKATTTAELAQAAGISEVTLFRYFSSKSELFLAGVEPVLAQALNQDPLPTQNRMTFPELVDLLVRRIRFLNENRGIVKLILNEHLEEPGGHDIIRRMTDDLRSMPQRYGLGIEEGLLVRHLTGTFLSFLYLPAADEHEILKTAQALAAYILSI